MGRNDETREDGPAKAEAEAQPEPGVVVLVAAGRPFSHALPLGESLEVGRGLPGDVLEDDDRASRRHVRLSRRDGRFVVEDLGSRNGTFVAGRRLAGESPFDASAVVRIGRSLLWLVDDVRPFSRSGNPATNDESPIIGGRLRRAFGEIALASRAGDTLYVLGESGAGKELAARAFHDARYASKGEAPFVAVNCAAIPEGLAERLLFGAKKGAYSGAVSDVDGYVQAADHGTLFLDEIAELDLLVQAKLLRVLESREVLPLGASQTKKVSFSVCVASHKRLRDEVSAGRFREDLYFRLGRPEVRLPPLRDRLDEIPWFVEREVRSVDEKLEASVTFFEECVRRPWPGNVRELLREVRRAAHRAVAEGSDSVEPEHLADDAGESLATPEPEPKERVSAKQWSDDEIARALDENGGNVRGTARVLGMHRNQLRRWLAKRGGGSAPNGGSTLPPSGE